MNNGKKKLIEMRDACISAKIGDNIKCPSCNTTHVKKAYNSVFCKSKGGTRCKDNYWNNVDPSKRNNTTRISPANASYYNSVILPEKAREYGFPDVHTMRSHVEEDGSMSCNVLPCEFCGMRYEYCRCD
jgi:hypothetical protein